MMESDTRSGFGDDRPMLKPARQAGVPGHITDLNNVCDELAEAVRSLESRLGGVLRPDYAEDGPGRAVDGEVQPPQSPLADELEARVSTLHRIRRSINALEERIDA